jgi:hypothetical protein
MSHTPFFRGTSQSHKTAYPKTTNGNERATFLSLATYFNVKKKKNHVCIKKKQKKVRMGAHPQEVQGK